MKKMWRCCEWCYRVYNVFLAKSMWQFRFSCDTICIEYWIFVRMVGTLQKIRRLKDFAGFRVLQDSWEGKAREDLSNISGKISGKAQEDLRREDLRKIPGRSLRKISGKSREDLSGRSKESPGKILGRSQENSRKIQWRIIIVNEDQAGG